MPFENRQVAGLLRTAGVAHSIDNATALLIHVEVVEDERRHLSGLKKIQFFLGLPDPERLLFPKVSYNC